MQVELSTLEFTFLLNDCLRGTPLQSGTLQSFVDKWYERFTELQRMSIFESVVRISCSGCFEAREECMGRDICLMKRYHPENQYDVVTSQGGRLSHHRAFRMNGAYYVSCTQVIDPKGIKSVEHLEFPEWQSYKQKNIDYNKNILEDVVS